MMGRVKKIIKFFSNVSTKTYLYSVAVAILPIMVIYGIIEEAHVGTYAAAITAFLGFGAAAVVPTTNIEQKTGGLESTGDKNPLTVNEQFDSEYYEHNDDYLT